MRGINPSDWQPIDEMRLEENALKIAKSLNHELVIAGPGAGKTELLAQKASFLLQTNSCQYPRKILAISFKKDAARNLKERFEKRCGPELARRFDSLTFDAFALQIFSRFRNALPEEFKCKGDYEVVASEGFILGLYQEIDPNFMDNHLDCDKTRDYDKLKILLPFHYGIDFFITDNFSAHREEVRYQVWQKILNEKNAQLTYKKIMLLAEYIIETNPKIKKYLQATYQYVFIDEVQDTSLIQYSFFTSCFLDSLNDAKFTAVGDDKQRIMKWAGALETIFEDFESDLQITRTPLNMNFRCAPKIVALLNYLSEHLLHKNERAVASDNWEPDQGENLVWIFNNPQEEQEKIYQNISAWIQSGVKPRDICILVKQQLQTYVGGLIEFLNNQGLSARDESEYQDVLSDELSLFILHFLSLVSGRKGTDSRKYCFDFLSNIRSVQEDDELLMLEKELSDETNIFIEYVEADDFPTWWDKLIGFIGLDDLRGNYPQYSNESFLRSTLDTTRDFFTKGLEKGRGLKFIIDDIFGNSSIPVMTIHKSKGLEYHSVIFVGLEDGAFWSFQTQSDEDKCAFFVALSRAKERVVFTLSKTRRNRWGNNEGQSINSIKEIYEILQESGLVQFLSLNE